MIRIRRRRLPTAVAVGLAEWQGRLEAKAQPAGKSQPAGKRQSASQPSAAEAIKRQWGLFNASPVRRGVERTLTRQSLSKCVYCENIGARTIDHFYPKLLHPAMAFTWENFNWACWPCNLNKGDALPMAGRQPLLVNPMLEEAADFFYIDPRTGYMVPDYGLAPERAERAAHTIWRLKLNAEDLRRQRRGMAVGIVAALAVYAETSGRLAEKALLHALRSGATMRAVVRQIMRSKEPATWPLVAACIERSRRVRRYVRMLGWLPADDTLRK